MLITPAVDEKSAWYALSVSACWVIFQIACFHLRVLNANFFSLILGVAKIWPDALWILMIFSLGKKSLLNLFLVLRKACRKGNMEKRHGIEIGKRRFRFHFVRSAFGMNMQGNSIGLIYIPLVGRLLNSRILLLVLKSWKAVKLFIQSWYGS